MEIGVVQRKARDMVSTDEDLVDVGQAEVGNFLNGFRLHILEFWLRCLIEVHDRNHHHGSWMRNLERRGGGCRISELSLSSNLSSMPCLPLVPHTQFVMAALAE